MRCDQCGRELLKVGLIQTDDSSSSYLWQCPNCKKVTIIYT